MARFKYMGEPARPGMVLDYGSCVVVRTNCTDIDCIDNETNELYPSGQEFVVDEDMGIDVECPTCLKHLRADNRFQEIV